MKFTFTSVGIALGITTLLVMIMIVLFHFLFTRKSKFLYIFFHSYYYWLIIGAVSFLYFFLARYNQNIIDFFNKKDLLDSGDIYYKSTTYSKAFLLDLCPAVAFLLPLSLMIDPTRSIAKIMSPYAIIGSIITIYSTTLSTTPNGNVWNYIFLGEAPNEMFFMMHFNSLVIAIGVMLTSKNYTRYSFLFNFVFICLYIGYVKAFVDLKGVLYNTTGVSKFDWYDDVYHNFSEYGIVYQLFPIGFPLIQIIAYIIAVLISFSLMGIKNWTNKDPEKEMYLDKFWYQKIKYIRKPFYIYDLKLDILFLRINIWILDTFFKKNTINLRGKIFKNKEIIKRLK